MVLQHINYKMPIYKDCTLGELLFISISSFLSLSISLFFITKILFGLGCIGFAIGILLIVPVTRFLCGRLQTVKYGKPYGYYHHLFLRKVHKSFLLNFFVKIRFLVREGKWSVRRQPSNN
jgi:conjugative transfer region protein (TIGR03750 family)